MISVVCVYNNERTLKNVLLKSLENQTVEFELITLDNRDNRYKSAADALNYGGAKANGDYIMFVHQDMWLGSNSWLEDAERTVDSLADLGVAGVAGMSEKASNGKERRQWSIEDFGELLRGSRAQEPEEVQTLDECLLVVPRSVFARLKFDGKTFDGWDVYGADYCLCSKQLGLKVYVIPQYCAHCCLRAHYYRWEFKDLHKYQKRLHQKHRSQYKEIHTWMGDISWAGLRKRELIAFLGPIFVRLFPSFQTTLERALSGCNSLLDLGCGYFSPIDRFNIPFSVGVELFEPYLQETRRKAIHSQYIKADLRRIEFKPKSFDAVIAVEVLEHLTKPEAVELISKMEQWAKKKVVITTPNGYLWQDDYDDNPLQEHRSGWNVEELRGLGFMVFGIDGWKGLRGYKAWVKYRPEFLWMRISELTQRITYRCPKWAFRLMAVKRTDEAASISIKSVHRESG